MPAYYVQDKLLFVFVRIIILWIESFGYLSGHPDAHERVPTTDSYGNSRSSGDRTLVYRQITTRIPILAFTESVVKTILTPDAISQIEIEMLQCLRGFLRCIRITAQGAVGVITP